MRECARDAANVFKKSHVLIKKAVLKIAKSDGLFESEQADGWGVDAAVFAKRLALWSDEQVRLLLVEMRTLVVAYENMSDLEREGVPRTLGEINRNVGALVKIARLASSRPGGVC